LGEFRCPRRNELFAYGGDEQGTPDDWREGRGLVNQTRGCSYCGSMHPDDFMQGLRDGHEVSPTDKNYKAYLKSPDGQHEGKFYYQHLSREQMQEFIDMINFNSMNIGYPGHFYRRPFFIAS